MPIPTSNYKDAQIEWFRSNQRLEPGARLRIEIIRKRRIITRLLIRHFEQGDVGVYQCRN